MTASVRAAGSCSWSSWSSSSVLVAAVAEGLGRDEEGQAEQAHAAARVVAFRAVALVRGVDAARERLRGWWRRQVALRAHVRAVGGQQLAARVLVRERVARAGERVFAGDVADGLA